jgi:hypothetical protein
MKHLGFESWKNSRGDPVAAIKRHVKYIETEKEHHQNTPVLFNEADFVQRREVYQKLNELPKQGVVGHKLVFTMSENEWREGRIDLKELVRESMRSYEMQKKVKLDWVAAIHHDEGHPHAHVVVLGRDDRGRQVGFYKKDIAKMQEIAEFQRERLAERNRTREMEREINRDLFKELEQERPLTPTLERSLEREMLSR